MSSTSEVHLSRLLNDISTQFNRYFSIAILLFGTTGNVLNCLVLSQPSLRSNPCAFLFLTSSIANIISIVFGLTTRTLAGWDLDFTGTHTSLCKLRVYILFVSRTTAFWLIALATVDRWCSSCNEYQRRQFSSLRNAQRGSLFAALCCSVCFVHVFYCYEANMTDAPLRCYGKTVVCRLITDVTYASITVLCPISVMAVFGLMTISNVRQTCPVRLFESNRRHRNTLMMSFAQQQRWRKIDRYLRLVLFRQVILLALLTIPQVVEKLYTTLTMHRNKSLLHATIDSSVYNFVLLLSFAASGMPFYIYTLSGGSLFRSTFLNVCQSLCRR